MVVLDLIFDNTLMIRVTIRTFSNSDISSHSKVNFEAVLYDYIQTLFQLPMLGKHLSVLSVKIDTTTCVS